MASKVNHFLLLVQRDTVRVGDAAPTRRTDTLAGGRTMYRSAYLLALAAALLGGKAWASDPIGGYVIVDKVVAEPGDAPTTVQVWGSIVLATQPGGRTYGEPQRGYLYYKLAPGKEEVCRKEWAELR